MTTQITKALIGEEDIATGTGTFSRPNSIGGNILVNKVNLRSFGTSIYNVKDYGALGDGSTNDTTAVQNAINAAISNGGGIVKIPKGVYRVNSTLIVPRQSGSIQQSAVLVAIVGEGATYSVIEWFGGANTCLQVTGDTSGNNTGLYMADFQIRNRGTGTIGLDLQFCTFSPVLERLQVWQFSDRNINAENFENGTMISCFVEMGTVNESTNTSTYGIYLDNANGVLLAGCQVHGAGNSNGSNGAYGVYLTDCDSVKIEACTVEGGGSGASPVNLDVGIYDAGGVGTTRGHGGNHIHAYLERTTQGIFLEGNSVRPARNYTIRGRISGNVTGACIALDWAENVDISQMHLQANAAPYITTTANTVDLHVGRNTYSNGTAITYNASMSRLVRPNEGWYWQAPIVKASGTGITATVGATDFVTSQIPGDVRIPFAAIYRLKIIVNTVGSGNFCHIVLQPRGSGTNEQIFLKVYLGQVLAGDEAYLSHVVRTSYNDHNMTYSVVVGTGWDIDYQIVEQAVYLG